MKLSGSNEYLCFATNNSRAWSSGFNLHMAFLVVEKLNPRQLNKYALLSAKGPFVEGSFNLKRVKYFNRSFCHNHLLTKPNLYAEFKQNR